jgi:alpha-L-fucosidase 2
MDTHPPGLFQIDGNFGAANGMLEALIQSRWMQEFSEVELLPALPDQWTDGSIEGVCVRGGVVVDMRWRAKKIVSLKLRAIEDGAIRLISPTGQALAQIQTSAGKPVIAGKDGVLQLRRGASYIVSFR